MTQLHEDAAADEATPRPLRRDAARNRAALVAAGREVFAERGFDASMDEVAHAAGVGVGTAYRHFANKYELAEAIFAEAIDEVVASAELAAAAQDPWAGLVEFVNAAAGRQATDRGLRQVMAGVHQSDQTVQAIHDRITGPVQSLFERAKAAGQIRPDAEPSDLGFVISMLCHVAEMTADVAPQAWRRYQAMLLAGLRPGAVELPVPALDDQQALVAMRNKKFS